MNEHMKIHQNRIVPWFLVDFFQSKGCDLLLNEKSMVTIVLIPKIKYIPFIVNLDMS